MANKNAVTKVKNRLNEIMGDCKEVIEELKTFKEGMEQLKRDLSSGTLLANGKKCKVAQKTTVKDCYEHIYGEIKPEVAAAASSGAPKDNAGGCKGKCEIF